MAKGVRHIEIRQWLIRNTIQKGQFELILMLPGVDIPADLRQNLPILLVSASKLISLKQSSMTWVPSRMKPLQLRSLPLSDPSFASLRRSRVPSLPMSLLMLSVRCFSHLHGEASSTCPSYRCNIQSQRP